MFEKPNSLLRASRYYLGGGSAKTVNPPKPLQIDIGQLGSEMTAADQAAYAQGDQYMQQYYPDLWNAQQNMIKQDYQNLTGPLDPTLQNTFMTHGNMATSAALGGGDQSFGVASKQAGGGGTFGGGGGGSDWGGSSLARNASAATVATDTQNYQDYNRAKFMQDNATWAPRVFGMTPEDYANFDIFNNTQINNYLQQKFAAQTQSYYQGLGASAAGTSSAIGAGASIISALIPIIASAA